jgi:hypothetical protein
MRTTFSEEIGGSGAPDTVLTQETRESEAEPEKDVKFPKRIKFRGRALAVIYRPSKHYANCRVAWTAGGRRMMKGFHRYGDAKSHTDQLVKNLAEAVEQFIATEEPRTQAKGGKRADLCPKYAYNRAIRLRRFAATFANTAVWNPLSRGKG